MAESTHKGNIKTAAHISGLLSLGMEKSIFVLRLKIFSVNNMKAAHHEQYHFYI